MRDVDESVKIVIEGSLNDKEYWKTTDQGAATLVVAGFDPKLDGTSSSLFKIYSRLQFPLSCLCR